MKREKWGGRLAFVLAAAGSAVGLGNVWKFPYITGENGGAAFILVYLLCIAAVGMPIMIAELLIGRASQKSPIAAFRALSKGPWWLVGAMGVAAGYVILSFYSVVAGWTGAYVVASLKGDLGQLQGPEAIARARPAYVAEKLVESVQKTAAARAAEPPEGVEVPKLPKFEPPADPAALPAAAEAWVKGQGVVPAPTVAELRAKVTDAAQDEHKLQAWAISKRFDAHTADKTANMIWHLLFMAVTMVVVSAGVKGGIETASKVLMPLLIVIILAIACYGISLEGGMKGVHFLVDPNFSKLNRHAIIEALGHAFFTLSLGMGAMLTYGSYLEEESNLYKCGLLVVFADTFIALAAGLAIYPIVFAHHLDPAGGPGLIFVTLPVVFGTIQGGMVLGAVFFFALLIAALTSAVSLLEVCVAHMIDEWGWSRTKATTAAGLLIFALGVPTAMGWNFPGLEKSFFSAMDDLSAKLLLPVGGMMMSIFVGWSWSEQALESVRRGDDGLTDVFGKPWIFLCRFVAPVLVLLVLLNSIGVIHL